MELLLRYSLNLSNMRTIIIEDEDLTAEDLCSTLKRLEPNMQLCARLTNVREAISYLRLPNLLILFSVTSNSVMANLSIFSKQCPPRLPLYFAPLITNI